MRAPLLLAAMVFFFGSPLWLLYLLIRTINLSELNINIYYYFLGLLLINIAFFLPSLGVIVRRMHDTGRNGWNWLWLFYPFLGNILLQVFLCLDSERGPNKYGPSEKYPEASTGNRPISLWRRFTMCFTTKYCCFEGRARRAEYWGYGLFYTLLFGLPLGGVSALCLAESSSRVDTSLVVIYVLLHLINLVFFLPSLGVCVRRLHDTGRSGWYFLVFLIPIVGLIVQLLFTCEDSARGSNQYGPSEKYPRPGDSAQQTACNYCPGCGAKLPSGANFCTNCGDKLV